MLGWFAAHGRHDLPWQVGADAYRVWISEIMLQQTQVRTVIPYYTRFVGRFPTLRALAAAEADEVLAHWSGLGYYARGRNLHRAARLVVERHGGELPRTLDMLMELPGIGRSTAGAILAQAFGERQAILDGRQAFPPTASGSTAQLAGVAESIQTYFGGYQTALIIRSAILEGAAFFAIATYLLEGLWWSLVVAIVLLLSHMFLEAKTTALIDSLEIAVVKFLNSITERYSEPAAPSPQPGMPRAPAPRTA